MDRLLHEAARSHEGTRISIELGKVDTIGKPLTDMRIPNRKKKIRDFT